MSGWIVAFHLQTKISKGNSSTIYWKCDDLMDSVLNYRITRTWVLTRPLPGPYQALTRPLPGPYQFLIRSLSGPYQVLTRPLPSPYQVLISSLSGPVQSLLGPYQGLQVLFLDKEHDSHNSGRERCRRSMLHWHSIKDERGGEGGGGVVGRHLA